MPATTTHLAPPLTLDPIAGPPLDPITPRGDHPSLLGRSTEADVRLLDESVSRRHALITPRAGVWLIADLESKHGTRVNDTPIKPNTPARLRTGDTVTIGPWVLRARVGVGAPSTVVTTVREDAARMTQIQRHAPAVLPRRAQEQLDHLIECAAATAAAATEADLAGVVLDHVLAASPFPRAALLRRTASAEQVEVIASRSRRQKATDQFRISTSLIAAASEGTGEVVSLADADAVNFGHSIGELRIQAALCAPITLGDAAVAYLYLDARAGDGLIAPSDLSQAATYCRGLARICGLALANLQRRRLELSQREFERELGDAHHVQQILLPPPAGAVGPLRYARHFEPGSFLAGDLFDVLALPGGQVAAFVGDVTGHGAAAAVVMAAAQTRLRTELLRSADLARAVAEVNAFVHAFSQRRDTGPGAPTLFMTLFCALFDPGARTLRFIDAGHGHWLLRRAAQPDDPFLGSQCQGTLPLGVDLDTRFDPEHLALDGADRLVLYSDGLVEQPSPAGDRFGSRRVTDTVRHSADVDSDVLRLVDALRQFAQTRGGLADDVTIASMAPL
ncbi:MAG: FHA domain-containing protein [Phycisphaerae bacterium]|nr:FHA domain-containing protein [Phycisphaerae bacterium]